MFLRLTIRWCKHWDVWRPSTPVVHVRDLYTRLCTLGGKVLFVVFRTRSARGVLYKREMRKSHLQFVFFVMKVLIYFFPEKDQKYCSHSSRCYMGLYTRVGLFISFLELSKRKSPVKMPLTPPPPPVESGSGLRTLPNRSFRITLDERTERDGV